MTCILISNAEILAGEELVPTQGSIFIEDGIIAGIFSGEPAGLPENTVIVDGRGAYVLPGLIDCHNHLSLDSSLPNYLMRMNGSADELRTIAEDTLLRDLQSGVTTSRCMGDRFYIDVEYKSKIDRGEKEGPKLFVSGIGMRSAKGHGYVGMPFDGVETLASAVRENIGHGADWIKYYATGTSPKDGKLVSYYSRNETAGIINTAHEAGKPVTAHCIGGESLCVGVELGIDCLEHLYFASESDVELIIKKGTDVCLTPGEYFEDIENAPAENQRLFKSLRPLVRKSMERVIGSGIKCGLGTDGLHGDLWKEARIVVEMGASNHLALKMLTVYGAKLLGVDGHTGKLAEGMQADVILLHNDPLEDISALSMVDMVIKGGKIIKNVKNVQS